MAGLKHSETAQTTGVGFSLQWLAFNAETVIRPGFSKVVIHHADPGPAGDNPILIFADNEADLFSLDNTAVQVSLAANQTLELHSPGNFIDSWIRVIHMDSDYACSVLAMK